MKVKYAGSHPEVKFRNMIFRRGETVEVGNNIGNFPADFEVDGKTTRKKTYSLAELKARKKAMGWKKFQEWADDNFGVKDTSESELYEEILDRQEGL